MAEPSAIRRVGTDQQPPLIAVRDLKKWFPIRKGLLNRVVGNVQAVDGISFDVRPRETLGLVGESGCGKTTAGRTLLRLIDPTSGSAMYDGVDLFALPEKQLRRYRRDLQIIFQDPFSSLNPRMTVESIIGEAMQVHGLVSEADARDTVKALLEKVGLQGSYVSRYPHEFSGGQRQRIGIARALALRPKFIVCDEAVSALDVSVQAQVINLLQDLQDELQLSYLFIAHDLSVVRHISDRVAVMYLGMIVELATCDELFTHPAHPYTQALLSAIPEPDPRRRKERILLKGDVPTPINPPAGCRFHTRCPAAFGRCRTEEPALVDAAAGHAVACHLYTEPARAGMSLGHAWREVQSLVRAGADVRLSGRLREGAAAGAVEAVGATAVAAAVVETVVGAEAAGAEAEVVAVAEAAVAEAAVAEAAVAEAAVPAETVVDAAAEAVADAPQQEAEPEATGSRAVTVADEAPDAAVGEAAPDAADPDEPLPEMQDDADGITARVEETPIADDGGWE